MKKIFFLIFILFAFSGLKKAEAQRWFLLSRQQKDSIIFHHTDKGNKYAGIGFSFGIGGGAWQVFDLKLKPSFGYFFQKNQQISGSIEYQQSKIQVDTLFRSSYQLFIGSYYRFYLPERKVLSPLFAEAGIYGGRCWAAKNDIYDKGTVSFYQLKIIVGFGIAFPINKFTLEIGMDYEYQLINKKIYHEYFAGRLFGILRFSYIF